MQQIRIAEDLPNSLPGGIETRRKLRADQSRVALVADLLCILVKNDRVTLAERAGFQLAPDQPLDAFAHAPQFAQSVRRALEAILQMG